MERYVAAIIKKLDNFSSVSQEYYNLFNFKEAKESNNAARIIKNTEEHFPCQSKIQQPFQSLRKQKNQLT